MTTCEAKPNDLQCKSIALIVVLDEKSPPFGCE